MYGTTDVTSVVFVCLRVRTVRASRVQYRCRAYNVALCIGKLRLSKIAERDRIECDLRHFGSAQPVFTLLERGDAPGAWQKPWLSAVFGGDTSRSDFVRTRSLGDAHNFPYFPRAVA